MSSITFLYHASDHVKPYKLRNTLTCPLYQVAYRIQCNSRAAQADRIMHPDLGKGHSNWPKAGHYIFTIYCKKDMARHHLHYMTSTNLGVL